jgi:chemotaxis protein CheX
MLNGVRRFLRRHESMPEVEAGKGRMTLTLRDSLPVVSDPKNLDVSVSEVFETMLGTVCERADPELVAAGATAAESVTAVVGFGGILSGACVISCGEMSGRRMTALMTGLAFESVDETVKDAIGEICNMLAGAWKSHVPELAANCGLSVPAVITGSDYNLHVQAPEFRLRHAYRSGDITFEVTVVCDGLL